MSSRGGGDEEGERWCLSTGGLFWGGVCVEIIKSCLDYFPKNRGAWPGSSPPQKRSN